METRLEVWSDIVFITLVTLIMFTMRAPVKGGFRATLQNVAFWVYVVYWVKTVGTIIRVPVHYREMIPRATVMVWFNWTGSAIVTLSTIVPMQLFLHYKMRGHFVRVSPANRPKFCLIVVSCHALAYLLTCVFAATGVTTMDTLLFCWRVFFYLNSALEIGSLFACLVVLFSSSKPSAGTADRYKSLKRHLLVTLYMRTGLCITITLKILHRFPREYVSSLHLFFILTGLAGYHVRSGSRRSWRTSIAAFFRDANLLEGGVGRSSSMASSRRFGRNTSTATPVVYFNTDENNSNNNLVSPPGSVEMRHRSQQQQQQQQHHQHHHQHAGIISPHHPRPDSIPLHQQQHSCFGWFCIWLCAGKFERSASLESPAQFRRDASSRHASNTMQRKSNSFERASSRRSSPRVGQAETGTRLSPVGKRLALVAEQLTTPENSAVTNTTTNTNNTNNTTTTLPVELLHTNHVSSSSLRANGTVATTSDRSQAPTDRHTDNLADQSHNSEQGDVTVVRVSAKPLHSPRGADS